MENFIIRKANIEDVEGIVYVNTYTWLTTYKNLIPDSILDERVRTMDERISRVTQDIQNYGNFYVATVDNRVVGMLSYGRSRNKNYSFDGEIYAIYVLEEFQGCGIGKKLFFTGVQALINDGYSNMILNVLDGNKAINFYQKYLGKKVGILEDYFCGFLLREYIMYFEDIKKI